MNKSTKLGPVMCDIDGCLADCRPFVKEYLYGKSDWEGYFAHQIKFSPIVSVIQLIKGLVCHNDSDLVIATGRPERTRLVTVWWLETHVTSRYYELLMRPKGFQGSTQDLKMGWFEKYKPSLVIDDDEEVIRRATEAGITVLQVHGFRWANIEDFAPDSIIPSQPFLLK